MIPVLKKHPKLLVSMVAAIFAVIGLIVSVVTSQAWLGVAVGFACQVTFALVLARITHIRVRRYLQVGEPPSIAEDTNVRSRWVTILFGQPFFVVLLAILLGTVALHSRGATIAVIVIVAVQAIGHSVLRRRRIHQ